jgi:hypothetical protein
MVSRLPTRRPARGSPHGQRAVTRQPVRSFGCPTCRRFLSARQPARGRLVMMRLIVTSTTRTIPDHGIPLFHGRRQRRLVHRGQRLAGRAGPGSGGSCASTAGASADTGGQPTFLAVPRPSSSALRRADMRVVRCSAAGEEIRSRVGGTGLLFLCVGMRRALLGRTIAPPALARAKPRPSTRISRRSPRRRLYPPRRL